MGILSKITNLWPNSQPKVTTPNASSVISPALSAIEAPKSARASRMLDSLRRLFHHKHGRTVLPKTYGERISETSDDSYQLEPLTLSLELESSGGWEVDGICRESDLTEPGVDQITNKDFALPFDNRISIAKDNHVLDKADKGLAACKSTAADGKRTTPVAGSQSTVASTLTFGLAGSIFDKIHQHNSNTTTNGSTTIIRSGMDGMGDASTAVNLHNDMLESFDVPSDPSSRSQQRDSASLRNTQGYQGCDNLPLPSKKTQPQDGNTCTRAKSGADSGTEDDRDTTVKTDASEAGVSRFDWEKIHAIPDSTFRELLHSVIESYCSVDIALEECHVTQRMDGGFHHVVFMAAIKDEPPNRRIERYVTRVPAIGTAARWQPGDQHNLHCEVALMQWLRNKTSIPLPEVVDFALDIETSFIGAPYILMKRMPGKAAQNVWYDKPSDRNHVTTNCVSPETEKKRRNILRSLAQCMSQLRDVSFNEIGLVDCKDALSLGATPTTTVSHRWKPPYELTAEDLEGPTQVYGFGPFKKNLDYWKLNLEENWPAIPEYDPDIDQDALNMVSGIRKIIDMLHDHPTIAVSKKDPADADENETFVIRHPDLDLQNILVDDDGNVTGIIDWDNCLAVPRCIGYASLPDFLRRDWNEDFSLADSPHMPTWEIQKYADIYADAMAETGCVDAKYTRKSGMYRAIAGAIDHGDITDVIEKLFAHIPGLRMSNVVELQRLIGGGWVEGEDYIRKAIGELLEPSSRFV
ncbi:hypothetical protein J4E81_007790 [Alternaria sp. BMP 2799]|nr:hypothetical protein J4E81_007790 [Alternaria sp. BMP 2799]